MATHRDHLGNEFKSVRDMAEHWRIPESTLHARLQRMPVEEALTATTEQLHGRYVKDHTGKSFPSITAMCEHWGITAHLYHGRIRCGYTLERALTEPIMTQPRNSKIIEDHEGNRFDSIMSMCTYWRMGRSTYNARRKNGWTIEAALTTPCTEIDTEQRECADHLGNIYPSQNAMCAAYGITHHTFRTRVAKLGWTLERALTEDLVINAAETADPFGNVFPSAADMYNYYGITESVYKYRTRRCGMTPAEALTTIPDGKRIGDRLIVRKRIDGPYYAVSFDGKDDIMTFDRILHHYHEAVMDPIPKEKLADRHLSIGRCLMFPHYEVVIDGRRETWDYWRIIRYRHDSNFGLSNRKGSMNDAAE